MFGYQVAGYELALDPHGDAATGPVTYWGVANAESALEVLLQAGAAPRSEGVLDVGDDIRTATVLDPAGSIIEHHRHHREPPLQTASRP
jgi:hypothetical protein